MHPLNQYDARNKIRQDELPRGFPSRQISRQRLCCHHRSYLGAANPLAKLGRDRSMTTKTQGTNVIQVALSPAFCYRQNVIGIPQAFTYLCLQTPVEHKRLACGAACPFQPAMLFDRVKTTMSANASIALEYMFAQVPWLRSQLPFVYAIVRAEGEAARRHLQRAPPAQATPVWAAGDIFAVDPTSRHHA
jgi:hypothetical protein